jgi:CO/xanthine dehydrogenase FAD-binding subunit
VLAEAANAAGEGIELQDDSFASARYRRRILPVLAERAIRQALASRQVHAD